MKAMRRGKNLRGLGRKVALLCVLALMLFAVSCGESEPPEAPREVQPTVQQEQQTGGIGELGAALLDGAEATITVDEDIELTQPLRVSGTKRLVGTGTITLTESADRMFTLDKGASLTLDGVTVNCAFLADTAFYVPAEASFTMLSGKILNAGRYGIDLRGTGSIEGGEMNIAGNSWINVEERGSLNVSGGLFRNAGDVGISVWKYATMTMSDGTLDTTGDVGIYNHGELTMTGGKITGTGRSAVMNGSKLTIDGPVEMSSNGTKGLLYNSGHATAFVRGAYLHQSASYGIYSEGGMMELEDVRIDGTVYSAVRVDKYGTIKAKNLEITASRSSGLSNYGRMEVKDSVIYGLEGYGVMNRGEALIENVTVEDVQYSAFCNNSTVSGGMIFGTLQLVNVSVPASDSFGIISYGGDLKVSGAEVRTNNYNLFVRDGSATVSDSALLGTDGRPCAYIGGENYKNASVTLNRVTMSGGSKGITNYGTVVANDCVFDGNASSEAGKLGGGIYNCGGSFTMTGGSASGNSINGAGGGIYNSGKFTATGVTFDGNTIVENIGAGVFNSPVGEMKLVDCVISGNVGDRSGGGLYNRGTATLENCTLTANRTGAENYGGGIYNNGTLYITGGEISENVALIGAGLYNNGTTVVDAAAFKGNRAEKYAGGIRNLGALMLKNATVTENINAAGYVDCDVYNSSTEGAELMAQLTLAGTNNISGIYKNPYSEIWVEDGFAAVNPILIRLSENADSSYWTSGTIVLLGEDAVLEKAASAFKLPADVTHVVLGSDGLLRGVNEEQTVEESGRAELWRDGAMVSSGLLSKMIREAKSGDKIVITEDIVASRYMRVNKQITITDDGTPRTVRTAVTGSNMIQALGTSKNPVELNIVGSETGGLVFTGKDAAGKITESSVPMIAVNYGKLNVSGNVTFRDISCVGIKETDTVKNSNINYGSAIRAAAKGEATLMGTLFENCSGAVGGALSSNGVMTLRNVTAKNCSSSGLGGLGYFFKGSGEGKLTLENCTITDCSASSNGGVVALTSGTLDVIGGTLSGNSSGGNGGAICATSTALVTIDGANVSGNSAKNNKGNDVYAAQPVTLLGQVAVDKIYLADTEAYINLPSALSLINPEKLISVYKESGGEGTVVLGGEGVAESSGCFVFEGGSEWYQLGADGMLHRDPNAPPLGTAELRRNGESVASGSLDEMLELALDGDTIVLKSDINIDRGLATAKDITITDDGTPRKVRAIAGDAYALTVQGTAEDKANVAVVGTVEGGITFTGISSANRMIVRDRAILKVSNGKLDISGKVLFTDIRNEGASGGAAEYCGSAITVFRSAELSLKDTAFENCYSKVRGGAIATGGVVTMDNVTTYNCSSDHHGGFFYSYAGTAKISNGSISNNVVRNERYGGAFCISGGDVELYRVEVAENRAKDGGGGAFYLSKGSLTIRDCLIENNTAALSGGVVFVYDGSLYIEQTGGEYADEEMNSSCIFRGNTAGEYGGALYIGKGEAVIDNAIFNRNAAESGGAIYLTRNERTGFGASLTMNGGRLVSNSATGGVGGAIRVAENAYICELNGIIVTGNDAKSSGSNNYGGGVAIAGGDTVLADCSIYDNVGIERGKDITATADFAVRGETKIGNIRLNGAKVLTLSSDPVTLQDRAAAITVQSYVSSAEQNVVGTPVLGGDGIGASLASFTYGVSGYEIDSDGRIALAESEDPSTDTEVEIVPGGGGGAGGTVARSLAVILEQARDGDVIVLKKDAVLDRAVTVAHSITVKGETGSETIKVTADGALTFSGAGKTINVENLAISGENAERTKRFATVNSGAVANWNNVTVSGIKTNESTGSVAYVSGGTLHLTGGTTVTGNTGAGGSSYGIITAYGDTSLITADSVTVTGNTHRYAPAFAAVRGATIELTDTTISNNTSTDFSGGAIYVGADNDADDKVATVTMTGGSIRGNASALSGGALCQVGGTVTLNGVTVAANSSAKNGGALYISAGALNVNGCTVNDGNEAAELGGAIYQGNGEVTVGTYGGMNTLIAGNRSSDSGAAIYFVKGNLAVTDASISGNETASGLGVVTLVGGSAKLDGVSITGNTSTGNVCGGLYCNGSAVTLKDSTVTDNASTATRCKDVYQRNTGSLTLAGELAIDKLRLNGAVIMLDETAPVTLKTGADKIEVYCDGAAVGTQVLSGSGIAASRAAFKSSEAALGIDGDGKLFIDLSAENIARLLRGGEEVKVGVFTTLLAEALDGDTIELLNNAAIEETLTFEKKLTISAAGKTFKLLGETSQLKFIGGADVTFLGAEDNNLVITGEGVATERAGAALHVIDGAKVTLNGVRLEKFYRTDNVGAVFYVAGGETSVTVIGGEISSNRTKLNSSVLRIDSGTMTVKDGCVITSNVTVGSRGDTFYVNGGTLVLDGVEVSGNGRASGTSSQGTVYLNKGALKIVGSTVKDNVNSASAGDVSVSASYVGTITLGGTNDIGCIKLASAKQTLTLESDFAVASNNIELLGTAHAAGDTLLVGDGLAGGYDKFNYSLDGHYIHKSGVVKADSQAVGAEATLTRGDTPIATDKLDEVLAIAQDGDVITLEGEITLGGELEVSAAVTLTGGTLKLAETGVVVLGGGKTVKFTDTVLDGQGIARSTRPLVLADGADAEFVGVTLKNVNNTATTENGAVALVEAGSTLALENSAVQGNTSHAKGGAFAVSGGTLSAKDTSFTGNRSYGAGGAVALLSGEATFDGASVSGNTARDESDANADGGAIYAESGTLTVVGGAFDANMAGNDICTETDIAVDGAAVLGSVMLGETAVMELSATIDAAATATVMKKNAELGTQILTLTAPASKPDGIVYLSADGTQTIGADGKLQVKTYTVTLDAASPIAVDCSELSQHGFAYEMTVSGAAAGEVYELSYWGADSIRHSIEGFGGKLTIPGSAVTENLTVSVRKLLFTVHTDGAAKENYASFDAALTAAEDVDGAIVTVHADGTLEASHGFAKNISIESDGYKRTVTVKDGGALVVNSGTLSISGSSNPNYLVFDGANTAVSKRLLTVGAGTATVENVLIEKFNYTSGSNGAPVAYLLDNASELTFTNCVIRGNSASGTIGALWAQKGVLTLNDTIVTENTSQANYAAVRASAGAAVQVNGGSISGNIAGTSGKGDIYVTDASLKLNGAVEIGYIRLNAAAVDTDSTLPALTLKSADKKIGLRYYVSSSNCDTVGQTVLSDAAKAYYELFAYEKDELCIGSDGTVMEKPVYTARIEKALKGLDAAAGFAAAGDASVMATADYTVTLSDHGYYTYSWKLVSGTATLAESDGETGVNIDAVTNSVTVEDVPAVDGENVEFVVTLTRWTFGVTTTEGESFYETLDAAIDAANIAGGTLTLYTDGTLDKVKTFSEKISITALGKARTITLDKTGQLKFAAGADVSFVGTQENNLVISGVSISTQRTGSAIYASGGAKGSFTDVTFTDLYRYDNVGAVFYLTGAATEISVSGGKVVGNKTRFNGCAAWIAGGTLTISDCSIKDNESTATRGDTLYIAGGNLVLDGVTVSGNGKTSGVGTQGAVYLKSGSLTVNDSVIVDNVGDSTVGDISMDAAYKSSFTLGGTNKIGYIALNNAAQSVKLSADFAAAEGITLLTEKHAEGDTVLSGSTTSADKFTVNDGSALTIGADGKLVKAASLLEDTVIITEVKTEEAAAEKTPAAASPEAVVPESGETAKEPEKAVTGEEPVQAEGGETPAEDAAIEAQTFDETELVVELI